VTDVAKLKANLLAAIAASDADGRYEDGAIDAIHATIAELTPHSPIPRPIDEQAKVAGPWKSLFAQFGPKHTAGKPITHETSFKLLSFNNLPDMPLRLLEIEQEIHAVSKDYNNVHLIETLDGSLRAHLIIFGHYSIEPDTPQRYGVEFSRVGLLNPDGLSDEQLRQAFGFAPDQSLDISFKPPKLHSDVVYCDDDLRINFGSMGGVYVMTRLHHHGHSVAFA
jgi:PAP_fibrillin